MLDLRNFEDVVLGMFDLTEIIDTQIIGIRMNIVTGSISSIKGRLLNEDKLSISLILDIVSLIYTMSDHRI